MSRPKNPTEKTPTIKPDQGELKLYTLDVEDGEVVKTPISQDTYQVVGA